MEINAAQISPTSQVARLLQLGLVLDWHQFPGFRAAFEPSKINWDLDVAEVVRRAHEISQGGTRMQLVAQSKRKCLK